MVWRKKPSSFAAARLVSPAGFSRRHVGAAPGVAFALKRPPPQPHFCLHHDPASFLRAGVLGPLPVPALPDLALVHLDLTPGATRRMTWSCQSWILSRKILHS